MIPVTALDPRNAFRTCRCRPLKYALRVLSELAVIPAGLALLQWAVPLWHAGGRHLPPVASWDRPRQWAAVSVLAVLSAWGIARLRLVTGREAS